MMDAQPVEDIGLLKNRITKGFSVLIIRGFLIKVFSFFGQVVLARILFPEDFGVYVIVVFIGNFFLLFSDIGLSFALIKKDKIPSRGEISTALYIKILLSVILITIIFFIAPYINILYPEFNNNHIWMLRVFSISILLTAIRSVPVALLEREIKYNVISLIDIFGVIAYYITALILAFSGFGVWSLIYGVLLKGMIEVIAAFAYRPLILTRNFKLKSTKAMFHFGLYLQGNGILAFIHTSVIPAIVGVKYGSREVGLLNWASNVASIPMSITDNFGRVAFSGFSRIQDDRKLLSLAVEKSMGILSIITLLFSVIILGFAPEIISILYTEKWLPGIPALYWFAVSTFFISAVSALGSGLLALGKSKDIFLITLTTDIIEWLLALLLISFLGFIGVAITATMVSFVTFSLYIFIAKKNGIASNLTKILVPKLLVLVISLALAIVLNLLLPQFLWILVVKVLVIFLFYIFLMFLFSKEDMVKLIQLTSVVERFGLIKSLTKRVHG